MEIAPDIYCLTGVIGTRPLYLFLLRGDERTVLLDTGCAPDPERFIAPSLQELGLTLGDVDLVINTHSDGDHCGGNHAMKVANPALLLSCGDADRALIEDPQTMWARRYNAYAAPHGLAYSDETRREMLDFLGPAQRIDWTWRGGEVLRLGRDWVVEIHHTPGHSAGHLSVFDPRSRTMLSGDSVQGTVYPDVEGMPALCPTYQQVDAYLSTIQYFEALRIDQLASCHWPLQVGPDVRRFLAESRQFVELTDYVLLEELRSRPDGATLAELIAAVGPRLGTWPRSIDSELMFALSGHLNRFVIRGAIIEKREATPWRYVTNPD